MMKRCRSILTLLLMALLLTTYLPVPLATAGSDELYFSVIHTNDEHAAILPTPLADYREGTVNPSIGGFARLAQAISDLRAEKEKAGEPLLVVSSGDYMAGSPFSWLSLTGQSPELSLMQQMGYDVVTLGNHEFDYGPILLANYLKAAGYPQMEKPVVVASNLDIPDDHPLNDVGLKETYIKTLSNGLKVGFFGIMGEPAQRDAAGAAEVLFDESLSSAQKAVTDLKDAGAQVIICLSHSSVDYDIELAQTVSGIHIIISGHCHTSLEEPIIEGETIIVQSGAYLAHLGMLELAYDPSTTKINVRNEDNSTPYLIPLDSNIAAHVDMVQEIDIYTRKLDELLQGLGTGSIQDIVANSAFALTHSEGSLSTPFGDWVTDAMRQIAEEATGEKVDFAFQANGVIRSGLTPGSMPYSQGDVTFYDLVSAVGLGIGMDGQPGYALVSAYLTGEEVRRVLEVSVLLSQILGDSYFLQASGLRATYDPSRAIYFWVPIKNLPLPSGSAVLSAERFAAPDYVLLEREDTELYHIVTDYYIASFLPMVGEMLPNLKIEMKNKEGLPQTLDEGIIYRDGGELKVWQAVVEFSTTHNDPMIPDEYQASTRLTQAKGMPIMLWPIAGLIVFLLFVIVLIRGIRKRRARKKIYY